LVVIITDVDDEIALAGKLVALDEIGEVLVAALSRWQRERKDSIHCHRYKRRT